MKLSTKLVLMFVLVLNITGCSVSSALFSSSPNKPIVIIDYPPNRIAYGGHFEPIDSKQLLEILNELNKRDYKDHHYRYPVGVKVNSLLSDTKTDTFSGSTEVSTKHKRKRK